LTLLAQRKTQRLVTKVVPLWIFNGAVVTATRRVLEELAKRSDVLQIRPSATVAAPALPQSTGTDTPLEQNLDVINARQLWDLGYRGQGVVVASLDTGVDATHPDLAASWRGGSNSWYDPNGQHPTTPTDVNGHGTWTIGVMVGGSASGTAIGVAPAAKWIAAKIFNDRGVATTAGIHMAFQWLLDPDGNPNTADAPNVVNDSWVMGATGCNLEFQLDLQRLRAAGIVPVFAAGNGGPSPSTSYSPANNPEALSVGAIDNSGVLDSTSSRGPGACDGGVYPGLVAPGDDITTSDLFGGYVSESGTSLAAPHVAGALALLLSAFPNASADQQLAALENSSLNLGAARPDNNFGYGRVDTLGAFYRLASTPDFTLTVSPSPASASPGGTVSCTVTAGAIHGFRGTVELSVSGLSESQASWTLSPTTISAPGGTATLTVTTSSTLAPGTYGLVITATSGGSTHGASVTFIATPPPDFTLSAAPTSASTTAGGGVSYTLPAGTVSGFGGDVTLSLSPAQGIGPFVLSTVTGGSGASILTASSLPP
jgi:subtilisin family serine protease